MTAPTEAHMRRWADGTDTHPGEDAELDSLHSICRSCTGVGFHYLTCPSLQLPAGVDLYADPARRYAPHPEPSYEEVPW